MSEITQEQLDAAVADAIQKAKEGMHSKSEVDAAIANAVEQATSKLTENTEAQIKLAVDKERSKREDIEKRLKAANKKQVPDKLEGLSSEEIESLLKVAEYTSGLSDEKRIMFYENMSSGSYQNMIIEQRNSWLKSELEPKDARIAELEEEVKSVRKEALSSTIDSIIKDAVFDECHPDLNAQQDGRRRVKEMFEDKLDDDGNLVPRQIGEHMGIDPETNLPFTAKTAAKYQAKTVFYLKKPSSNSDTSGNGKDPIPTNDGLSLQEKLDAAKTKEERQQILAKHKAALKAS